MLKAIAFVAALLTFEAMKRRFTIINSGLVFAILFSMLLQSVHSYEHLSQLFSEKQCHHKYTGKDEISHQHHPFDHCFACEFTFSNFIEAEKITYQLHAVLTEVPYFYTVVATPERYSGSSRQLRGPPSFIV